MKPLQLYLKKFALLLFLILAVSSCDSDGSSKSTDEFTRSVAEEAVVILEQLAGVVTQDCGETFTAWEAIDRQFTKNNLGIFRPRFNADQQNRANAAISKLQDTLARCWPDSDFTNLESTDADTTVNCSTMCPISDWHCFVFTMECAAGDNQACCFSGACTGNCIDTCMATDGCQDVCPNGPNGPPDGP